MTDEEIKQGQTLDSILANAAITTLFQPIVSLKDNKIFGYEALSRGPSDSTLHSPINLFDAASRHGRIAELDLLCRELAIQSFGRLKLPAKLFINTIPAVLLQPDYQHGLTLSFLKDAGLSADRVVIELTEQYPIDDYRLMRDATAHYRAMGFSIALDDLGAGYAGLRTWSELKPDFVKLDRHFMQNIHDDRTKFQFVKSMLDIAHSINCKVVGEGVEIREEYLAANKLGLDFGQGYYFARPSNRPSEEISPELFTLREQQLDSAAVQSRSEPLVEKLLMPLTPVYASETLLDVGERFQNEKKLESLPVVDHNDQAIGMVSRNEFMTIYASRYGRDLHGRKPIANFIDEHSIVVDITMPLKKLSTLITSQPANEKQSMFVITDQSSYRGVGSVMDLLRQITELQITTARHANPLTGLPGNVPINTYVQKAIREQRDIIVCYLDLDNFKPYNDTYSFEKGDKVLYETAKVLLDVAEAEYDFVGHVGGDDFIVIFESEDWFQKCRQIHERFNQLHDSFYKQEHLDSKGIESQDRHGNERFFQLLSISIGAVRLRDFGDIKNEADLASYSTKAKSIAKKARGNSIYLLTEGDCLELKRA